MTAIILTALVVAGLAVNGLRLRARVPSALPVVDPGVGVHDGQLGSDDGRLGSLDGQPGSRDGQLGCEWAWITARDAAPDDATRLQATAYARAEGLDLLELVPRDLPPTAARDLLRAVDPREYRANRLAAGRSAGAAVCVARLVAERAETGVRAGLEAADVIASVRLIRPYARGRGAAIATAPGLRSAGDALEKRRARLRANGVLVPVHLTLDAVGWIVIAVALLTGWEWGLGAVVAYCLQPYLIFAGTTLRPRGLHAAALLRPVHTPIVLARTVTGRWRSAAELEREAELAEAVTYYRDALADGIGRFLEERRPDCPWCGSAKLSVLVRSPDLVIGKPGTFTLEKCGGCGHVFQNPRLSPEGLSFYYRDVYDGLGAAGAERVFLTGGEGYRDRAAMLKPFTTPKAWLDIGAGHGHFCAIAAETWPDTVFDGLDQGAGITEAERRGWITTAYRGEFPELASTLTGRYDVISMHHYLEHTRDPRAELDAAAQVLSPGGYLLIELPDPRWPLAPIFGRYWMPWFQPQHQHMMPLGNLTAALAERGLRVVATERGPAHIPSDAAVALVLLLSRLAPDRGQPWSTRPPTAAATAWRGIAWMTALPVIAVALVLDRSVGRALARRLDHGNAYRVLARRQDIGNDDR
jgi:SAM-dependent methyltransferase